MFAWVKRWLGLGSSKGVPEAVARAIALLVIGQNDPWPGAIPHAWFLVASDLVRRVLAVGRPNVDPFDQLRAEWEIVCFVYHLTAYELWQISPQLRDRAMDQLLGATAELLAELTAPGSMEDPERPSGQADAARIQTTVDVFRTLYNARGVEYADVLKQGFPVLTARFSKNLADALHDEALLFRAEQVTMEVCLWQSVLSRHFPVLDPYTPWPQGQREPQLDVKGATDETDEPVTVPEDAGPSTAAPDRPVVATPEAIDTEHRAALTRAPETAKATATHADDKLGRGIGTAAAVTVGSVVVGALVGGILALVHLPRREAPVATPDESATPREAPVGLAPREHGTRPLDGRRPPARSAPEPSGPHPRSTPQPAALDSHQQPEPPRPGPTAPRPSRKPAPAFTNSIGMRMVYIRPGSFLMGSSPRGWGREPREGPQHRVTIGKAFYMSVHEVRQSQYRRVMHENPSKKLGDDYPVERVTWHAANAFCRELSAIEGRPYRLPTEAEWEYACRADSETPFSFGSLLATLRRHAWYRGNSGGETHPVGLKKPNGWGLCDMHGNVWEWCRDRHGEDYYAHSPSDDPQGPATGTRCVLRGGSCKRPSTYCRSAYRLGGAPHAVSDEVGFRVVCAE